MFVRTNTNIMTNIRTNKNKTDVRSHMVDLDPFIDAAFKIIDEWLPKEYVTEVKRIVPVSAGSIRNIRSKKKGNIKVINAMVEVALNNKAEIEKLRELIK